MKNKRIETKKMTLLALCASVALILSYIEFMLPPILTIAPGIDTHSYDPSVEDIIRIKKSNLFISSNKYADDEYNSFCCLVGYSRV